MRLWTARSALLLLLLAGFVPLCRGLAAEIKTNEGKIYQNVKVSRVEPDGIVIITKTGVIKLYFLELPKDVQEKYGYDPAKAAAFTAAEAEKRRRQEEATPLVPQSTAPPERAAPAPPQTSQNPDPSRFTQAPGARPAPNAKGVVLDRYWETMVLGGGSATRRDLGRLLSSFAKSNPNLNGATDLEIYPGVTYLTPVREAAQRLGVAGKISTKNSVASPGFPKSSIFYYSVDGMFEGEYNRMLLITDKADQVLSIQLVAENPGASEAFHHWYRGDADWHCYNFINHRVKTVATLRVRHLLSYQVHDRWRSQQSNEPIDAELVRADLFLVSEDLHTRHRSTPRYKVVEASRWYVPRPFAELILYCLGKATG